MFKKEQVFKTRLDIHRHRLSRAKLPTAVGGAVGTGAFRSVLFAFEKKLRRGPFCSKKEF